MKGETKDKELAGNSSITGAIARGNGISGLFNVRRRLGRFTYHNDRLSCIALYSDETSSPSNVRSTLDLEFRLE